MNLMMHVDLKKALFTMIDEVSPLHYMIFFKKIFFYLLLLHSLYVCEQKLHLIHVHRLVFANALSM